MALVRAPNRSITLQTGTGTNTYVLGDASDGLVSTWMVSVHTTSAGTVAITPKARPRGIPITETVPAFVPLAYLSLAAAGVASAGATYATAALAGSGDLIHIPASGLDIALDVTFTSGVHVVTFVPVLGAAA